MALPDTSFALSDQGVTYTVGFVEGHVSMTVGSQAFNRFIDWVRDTRPVGEDGAWAALERLTGGNGR